MGEVYVCLCGVERAPFASLQMGGKKLLQGVFGESLAHCHSSIRSGDLNAVPKLWPLSKLHFPSQT